MKLTVITICVLLSAVLCAAGSNLNYWLESVSQSKTQPTTQPATQPATQLSTQIPPHALPGRITLSDGRQMSGWVFGTWSKPFSVFVEAQKRWRRVPLAACSKISAAVVSEQLVPQWRWKEMGSPEKVYTGKSYVTRRFVWIFTLIDGTEITGTVKGQPLWIVSTENSKISQTSRKQVYVLHERQKGPLNTPADKVLYLKEVVISY